MRRYAPNLTLKLPHSSYQDMLFGVNDLARAQCGALLLCLVCTESLDDYDDGVEFSQKP